MKITVELKQSENIKEGRSKKFLDLSTLELHISLSIFKVKKSGG